MATDGRVMRSPDDDVAAKPGGWRMVTAWVLTALACLLVLFALVAPDDLSRLSPAVFLRVPVEGLAGVALLLVLPAKPRRVVAALLGALLGLLTIVKLLDMGFYSALARPFDPVFDWTFFGPGLDFLTHAVGRVGAIAAAIGAALVAVGLVIVMMLSVLRLTRHVVSHRITAARSVIVLGVIWIICAVVGVQIVPDEPVASKSAAALAYGQAHQVVVDLKDHEAFTNEVAADAFRDTPGGDLLTGLRGKDVVLTFVESYGRVAVQDSDIAPGVDALLDAGTSRLHSAGFAAKSAFITSSTSGGGSWLAHSTMQSGVWINNQKRYDNLVAGDRFTLTNAFRRAGWRTVADVPQNTWAWPEQSFYGYDQYYDGHNAGYKGPNFFYAAMPDQYTLSAFHRNELAKPGHQPVMAEIDLVSSHTPWAPIPKMIDWNTVGDGSIFKPMPATGKTMEEVWPDPTKIRAAYGESIQYSLESLISYVETYGDNNLVLIFLGDHQPAPVVTGPGATRDVPVTIVARDPAVLDRISGWGWHDGLNPGPKAPVMPMNAFRDQFLTAFGSPATHPHTPAR